MESLPFSSPDEFPRPRDLLACFSGLNDRQADGPYHKRGFARHRDDMPLANFQRVRGLDAEWKLLRCPTKHHLPNLTPLRANRNFGANCPDVVPGGIFKRDVNVAVCFHFCVNDAPSESVPLFSDGIRASACRVKFTSAPIPSHA